uniref:Protein kinase domain-containing protein n=1 Tax=Lactuca sativa TaxID=4236 RepID=A0A9R1VV50_LACSA|nr:hypothetical protein LSAT_V11C400201250 [Lactuca sativa]
MKNPLFMICDKGPEKSKGPEKAIDFGLSLLQARITASSQEIIRQLRFLIIVSIGYTQSTVLFYLAALPYDKFSEKFSEIVGSPYYMAPEVLLLCSYGILHSMLLIIARIIFAFVFLFAVSVP